MKPHNSFIKSVNADGVISWVTEKGYLWTYVSIFYLNQHNFNCKYIYIYIYI